VKALKTRRTFPPGLDALYARMMEQICTMEDAEDVDLRMQILSVVSTVYRPVTLEELGSFLDHPRHNTGLSILTAWNSTSVFAPPF
jgi:hypothetical protein